VAIALCKTQSILACFLLLCQNNSYWVIHIGKRFVLLSCWKLASPRAWRCLSLASGEGLMLLQHIMEPGRTCMVTWKRWKCAPFLSDSWFPWDRPWSTPEDSAPGPTPPNWLHPNPAVAQGLQHRKLWLYKPHIEKHWSPCLLPWPWEWAHSDYKWPRRHMGGDRILLFGYCHSQGPHFMDFIYTNSIL
jgi:hypothetical protein